MQILHADDRPRSTSNWLIPEWIGRDALTLLVGAGGSSKSWTAIDLSIAAASAQTFLGKLVKPARVLFVDEDGQVSETFRRIHRLCAGRDLDPQLLRDSFYIAPSWGLRIDQPAHYHDLATTATKLKVDMIVIDALCAIHSADENDNKAMGYVMRGLLRNLMRETGAGILLLHHEGKPGEIQRLGTHKARGATEIINSCDAAISCSTKDDHYSLNLVRSRYLPRPEWPSALVYGMADTDDATFLVHESPQASRLQTCIEALKTLPEPPGSVRRAVLALGGAYTFATVARALSQIRLDTRKA